MTDLTHLIDTARQQSLGDLPRRTARTVPGKVAVVDGPVSMTYAELAACVDRTAAALHDAGLRKGDRIALLSHNCWQFAVLDFATARLGLVLVPVNFMLGASEIAFILRPPSPRAGSTGRSGRRSARAARTSVAPGGRTPRPGSTSTARRPRCTSPTTTRCA